MAHYANVERFFSLKQPQTQKKEKYFLLNQFLVY